MNTNMAIDADPLSTYEYPLYGVYETPMNLHSNSYNLKLDENVYNTPQAGNEQINIEPNYKLDSIDQAKSQFVNANIANGSTYKSDASNNNDSRNDVNEDVKPDIKDSRKTRSKKNKTGRRSSYFAEKIKDAGFPFYGCAVCNISFPELHELDRHVITHKGRVTSYHLRVKNRIKRKMLKKQHKKSKVKKKIKQEIEFEIKPEDGYIGNETAANYINNFEENKTETMDNTNSGHIVSNSKDDYKENATKTDTNESAPYCDIVNGYNQESVTNNENRFNINSAPDECNDNKAKTDSSEIAKGQNDKNINLEKIYKCFACKKQFQLSYYLKLHVRSHTDEKPYQCPECGDAFITASKLGRHNKRVHLAIKYQCRICFKTFARFENLTHHFDKLHAEAKLEGEPYDYNAILPYLKEMEQELREKAEAEENRNKELKTENLWHEEWLKDLQEQCLDENTKQKDSIKESDLTGEWMLEVKVPNVDLGLDMEVKQEVEDLPPEDQDSQDANEDHLNSDSIKDEGFKDENIDSDEDYFPDNTWTEPPPMDMEPMSPQTAKNRNPRGSGSKQCKICQKKVSSSSYMKVHLRTHTGERPFKCYICNRGFITASKMHRHAMTHQETWKDEENPSVKTEKVDGDVQVKVEPTEVDKAKKKSQSVVSYQKAKDRFYKKMKRNQETKTSERGSRSKKRPHPCEYCQKRFLHLETLNIHRKSHEGEVLVRKCYYCLMKLDDEEALKTHESTHDGPKPYVCTLCGKSYKRRETMIYHRKNHKPDKKYICDVCSKSFNSPCKLQKHLVGHRAGKFVLRYECPVCAHMFNTKYHIQMHLTTHQKEGLIIEENRSEILAMVLQNARRIPKSPDAPPNLSDLIPSDERSRVCNICGAVFQHFYYLEEHLKSHGSKIAVDEDSSKEEKKYICQVCQKGFKLHYYLKLHSFTHTKEKPFICQQCGKGFITKGKLKRHLETHTGLKKYQCHICYKFFTRPSYLRIHVRTIHGTQDNFRTILDTV